MCTMQVCASTCLMDAFMESSLASFFVSQKTMVLPWLPLYTWITSPITAARCDQWHVMARCYSRKRNRDKWFTRAGESGAWEERDFHSSNWQAKNLYFITTSLKWMMINTAIFTANELAGFSWWRCMRAHFTVRYFNWPCMQASLSNVNQRPKTAVTLVKLHQSQPLRLPPTQTHLLPQLSQLSEFSCQSGQYVCSWVSCISLPLHTPKVGR